MTQKQKIDWDSIGLTNDLMFKQVMKNPKICKKLLELILGKKIQRIEYIETEKVFDISLNAKGIRLDVYLADSEETIYNIEMQAANVAGLPERSRYYQGMIDLDQIQKGQLYTALPDTYIIFLCNYDPFGKGKAIYTFRTCCIEDRDLFLEDGSTKIFLNANGSCEGMEEEFRDFLSFLCGKAHTSPFVDQIEEEMTHIRSNENWRVDYMKLEILLQERQMKGESIGNLKAAIRVSFHNYKTLSAIETACMLGCEESLIVNIYQLIKEEGITDAEVIYDRLSKFNN